MVLSLDRWVGKVAVVTGTSAGIGAAIAEALVKSGVIVAGLARRKERTEELSKKLSGEKGKLHAVKCDVTSEEDIVQAFKWVKENLGPVSILVNNAGLAQATSLIDGDTAKWKKVLDTNVLGLCIATREAIKDMKANNIAGHIFHINSVAGHKVVAPPILNIYFASKFAVTALAETLRYEINSQNLKIRITSVSPGLVETEILEVNFGNVLDLNAPELKIALKSEDIADAVIYALSTPPHVQVSEVTVQPVGEIY
ncbi:farnesol dehydrogenase-like [Cylas formicarius]|uniref:farnesol dehydrogenase-like n=1 Tax=Cylas formicarius TaxID=197179 RepID=UPI002958B087|nr:farnesol dehydrogenase-like [Cylas formicarius]